MYTQARSLIFSNNEDHYNVISVPRQVSRFVLNFTVEKRDGGVFTGWNDPFCGFCVL
jgi:hypothetical protein